MAKLQHWVEFLTPSELDDIHRTSMKLLAEVGVQFPDDDAIDTFKRHGFRTDGQRVYFTEAQVMQAVQSAPAQFTLHARNSARDVTIGGGETVFVPGYGTPFLMDAELGRREATVEDYHNLMRLAHALPNQDLSGHLLVEPRDVRPDVAHLHMLHAAMLHSDKPLFGSSEGAEGAQHTFDMVEILFGERPAKPVVVGLINPLTPLGYGTDMIQALMAYALAGQPAVIATMVLAGSTGPITLAGTLALQNAETLAGVVLTQLLNPGAPVIYGSTSTALDMQGGNLSLGGPELPLIITATAQLARFYQLPCRSGGSITDSHTADIRAGYESSFNLLTAINSGVDFMLHSAGILSSYLAFSFEKFVLDDDRCGLARRYRRGLTVDADTLAYDVIAKVGPGGHFLMEDHTFDRCRTEFWQSEVNSRDDLATWEQTGAVDTLSLARARWQMLVAEHQDPPLDGVTARQLKAYVDKNMNNG
jgi:trimethylamine--corrinoid protein Co-methyltransferase